MTKAIERRAFLKFGIALGGVSFVSLVPHTVYALEGDAAFSKEGEIELAVVGEFAHRIMRTIDKNVTVEYLGAELAECNSSSREERLLLDVGSARKSRFLSKDVAADRLSEGVSGLFLDGTFEGLPGTYRDLGALLGNDRCDAMANYLEEVVELIRSLSVRLSGPVKKRLYIACGEMGLAFETFNYYQESFLHLLNCECINNLLAENNDSNWLDVRALADYQVDAFIFRDCHGLEEGDKPLFNRIWTDIIRESEVMFVPEYAYDWFNDPLISQGLGVLWLGNALYPDDCNIKLTDYANRYYALFGK